MLVRFHRSHLSHTFSSLLFYISSFSSVHSFHLFLFSLSWTLTLHLRNSAFSAVRWCLIATWFSLCCHLCLFALLHPLTTFQSFLLLLSNLAPPPPTPALLALFHLLPSLHTFSSPLRLNLVMHGKDDEHLLGPRLVGQAASSPLKCLTSNYTRAWAFLSLLTSLLHRLPLSISVFLFSLQLNEWIMFRGLIFHKHICLQNVMITLK